MYIASPAPIFMVSFVSESTNCLLILYDSLLSQKCESSSSLYNVASYFLFSGKKLKSIVIVRASRFVNEPTNQSPPALRATLINPSNYAGIFLMQSNKLSFFKYSSGASGNSIQPDK